MTENNKFAGIYIHIPFCRKKCGYCDFYSVTNLNILKKFIENLKKEIDIYKDIYRNISFDTIYFGGGTPSILGEKELEEILNKLSKNFSIAKKSEITIEVNPEDIIEKNNYIKALKSLGINRISYGMQSLKRKHLMFLNRYCNVRNIKYALDKIISNFDNINVDIIHSIPGMDIKDLSETLKYVIKLKIPHISTYSLIYEEDTKLFLQVEKKEIKPASSNEEYKQYKYIKETLESNSYNHYEISNFAKDGYESRHNLKYWEYENYLGLGPSSHSFINLERWNNFKNIIRYNISLEKNKLPIERRYKLTKKQIETEIIYLGLRSKGIDLKKIKAFTGIDFKKKFKDSISTLIKNGFAEFSGGRFKLTREGMFLADEIMVKYF